MSTPKIVNLRDRDEAQAFLATFELTVDAADQRALDDDLVELTEAVEGLGHGYKVPRPVWVGVRDDSGELVAALHAGPPVEQALEVLHGEPNLQWLALYLTQNLLIHEMAVREDSRRQGIASALLRRAHSRAHALTGHSDAAHVTAFASSASAVDFFRANGYTIGAEREPVPAEKANGLNTLFHPDLSRVYPDGRWTWATLSELELG